MTVQETISSMEKCRLSKTEEIQHCIAIRKNQSQTSGIKKCGYCDFSHHPIQTHIYTYNVHSMDPKLGQ